MLRELEITNIALIEKLSLEPGDGMTVLTGETGAGKSIIIDAVNLLLGARTNKSLVRYGTEKARVQGLFDVSDGVLKNIGALGIEAEDNQLLLCREITRDGKSVCRINGIMTAQSVLREVGAYLINIHGQHDNQALLNPARHIDFLDSYAKTDLTAYSQLYNERKQILKEIGRLSADEQERMQRIDLLSYQVKEIEAAGLRIGEKDELYEQKKIIDNAEKIAFAVNEAYSALYEDNSAYDAISRAADALLGIAGIDGGIDETAARISEMKYIIEDSAHELKSFANNVDFDENTLNDIEERLDLITKMERKYGGSEEKVLEYYENAAAELSKISNADAAIEELNKKLGETEKKLSCESGKISEQRQAAAKRLQTEIEKSLFELDMPKVRFEAAITKTPDYTPKGAETAEFMICPNVGEQMKPLAEIASGGELSRVMLAVKSILSDGADTLIFDEIDTGVSGSAAQKIAKKLSALSKGKQVICVSHQPQLAAACDNHYFIKKSSDGERTVTNVKLLNAQERVMEIARIIDGDNITETAVKHAKEMLGI